MKQVARGVVSVLEIEQCFLLVYTLGNSLHGNLSCAIYTGIQLLHMKSTVIRTLLDFDQIKPTFWRVTDYVPLKTEVNGDGKGK